ncbi:glycosyl hydrolase [Pseudonocardia sp. NPDC049154]|uniref:glycosyl hydrolase n=1 Tax=Pseudonocardia sp. NPDC049154 TaxID=3155501 RepID=UPI0033F3FAF0
MSQRRWPRRLLRYGAIAIAGLVVCGLALFALRPESRPPGPQPPAGHASACTNSDGTACPASYFTGPLGDDNLVPGRTGAFLIEYYAGVGVEWPQVQMAIRQRQQDLERTFDGIQIEYGNNGYWDGVYGIYDPEDFSPRREQWIIDNGSFPVVSWTPGYTISQMNSGAADEILRKAARYFASFAPHRIMLRPFVEFNWPSSVTSAVPGPENGGVNSCGDPFVQAWRHMVDVFRDNGATNVGFWFTPEEGADRECAVDSYPGDTYVDWVGSDRYNRCLVNDESCYSSPLRPGPATFSDLFGYRGTCADEKPCKTNLHDTFGPRKPFVVGEVGTVYDVHDSRFKGDFYRTLPVDARELRYLRGVAFFDADVSAIEGADANWRVDFPLSDPDPYQGFASMARDAWFSTQHG